MLKQLKEKLSWLIVGKAAKAALVAAVTALVAAGLLEPEFVRELVDALLAGLKPSA